MQGARKQNPRRRRWPWIILLVVLIIGAVLAGTTYYKLHQTANAVLSNENSVSSHTTSKVSATKPISVLLLGADTGEDGRTYTGRSDTIIVATINPKTKKTTMMSIPRDTLAKIKGTDTNTIQKINAAYELGGANATKKTIESLLNIPIDYTLTINMKGLKSLVDAVGGVTVTSKYHFTFDHVTIKKGTHHLSGKEALSFARMRYDDPLGDYGRQMRQQQVIKAVSKKLLSTKNVANYNKILNIIKKNVSTNMDFKTMLAMAEKYRAAGTTIQSDHLQGQGAIIDGSSYQIAATKELQRVSKKIRNNLGLATVTVKNTETALNAANPDFNGNTYTAYNIYATTNSSTATAAANQNTNTTDNTATMNFQTNQQTAY